MTDPIERMKRARERYGESSNVGKWSEKTIRGFLIARGWTVDMGWTNEKRSMVSSYTALQHEVETDLTELIAAVDAVVKGESEHG